MPFYSNKLLASSLVLGLILIATEAPIWITSLCAVVLLLRFYFDLRNITPWSPKVSVTLAVLLIAEVYLRLGTLISPDATLNLVLGLTGLRIMDYRDARDNKFLVLLGFIVVALKPIFSLDLAWLPPSILAFLALWASMFESKINNNRLYLFKVFTYSIPLAVFLFLLFPRVVLPWAKEKNTNTGLIGFSESLNPGSLAELVPQDILAFRVKFLNGPKPQVSEMYWRGAVLDIANGFQWKPNFLVMASNVVSTTKSQNAKNKIVTTDYEVTLEDLNTESIFLLDRPLDAFVNFRTQFYSGSFFKLQRKLGTRFAYKARSIANDTYNEQPTKEHLVVTELGEKTYQLVKELKATSSNPKKLISAVDKFFKTNNFKYSLTPGEYLTNNFDEFLFERKTGFCEHYASAYASLLRALGVPARVVIGFHGASYNAFGDFWEVSYKDAHAWVDLFVDGKWTTSDPISFVEPRRIELGGSKYFLQNALFSSVVGPDVLNQTYRLAYEYGVIGAFNTLVSYYDHLNFLWVNFVMNFSLQNQYQILLSPGIFLLFTLLFVFMFIFYKVVNFSRQNVKLSITQRQFEYLERRYSRRGYPRHRGETPSKYLLRLAEYLKNNHINDFLSIYVSENYKNELIDKNILYDIMKRI